jgi:hypothetical protein
VSHTIPIPTETFVFYLIGDEIVDTEKSCSEDDPIGASNLHHDILPLSETFKLVVKIQLTLMVFSAVFWGSSHPRHFVTSLELAKLRHFDGKF